MYKRLRPSEPASINFQNDQQNANAVLNLNKNIFGINKIITKLKRLHLSVLNNISINLTVTLQFSFKIKTIIGTLMQ